MEFDGQSEIPESGIKEAVMSTADHSSDHRTVIYLQRDRGILKWQPKAQEPATPSKKPESSKS